MEHLWLGRRAWLTFETASDLEWLETNGLGGWAYGTVGGASTRLYHAVLAASLQPPTQRMVLLARLEETVYLGGRRYPLYTNGWASGHVEAEGLTWLQRFGLAPFPTWTYAIGDLVIEKRLFMCHGENTTVIRYRLWQAPGGHVRLTLTPLVACRSIHTVQQAGAWCPDQRCFSPSGVEVQAWPDSPRLYLSTDQGTYETKGGWVHQFYYPYEALRGEATMEDLYRIGRFTWECAGDGELTFAASAQPLSSLEGPAWERRERKRRQQLLRLAGVTGGSPAPWPCEEAMATLVLAADQFVAQRASTSRATILAGYPWFTDWGRDTMVALPGLTLSTGRHRLARELLQTFAAYEQDGLIPNHFPEYGGEPLYNTADASLWFFEATWLYLEATGDGQFVQSEIYPVLLAIAEAHLQGTHFDIRLTEDGLLRCGNPEVQVTWMDAKVGDLVVTPRDGAPVEIQALLYNALTVLSSLAERFDDPKQARRWQGHARAAQQAFYRFWNPVAGCLYDRLCDDGSPDPSIRPNQLLALSLSHPLLHGDQARSVVDCVFRELYTPYGIRSLSPHDPSYAGRYEGTRLERDQVYHQGTVWAWLMGPFLRAYLHAYGRSPSRVAHARALLRPLVSHLTEFGLGSVAEIFDGDPPHQPRGCVAQAWSVAELLRLLKDDLA